MIVGVKHLARDAMDVMLVKRAFHVNQNVKMVNIAGLYIKKKLLNAQVV